MSPYRSSKHIHSPKYLERKKKRKLAIIFLGLLCFFTISATAILLLRSPFFQVKKITVEGATFSREEALASAALSSLSGNYLGIIPKSNTFFFSRKHIRDSLLSNFSEVQNVNVHRRGFSGLELAIHERAPAAIVCAGFREDEEESKCYWSDERGLVYAHIASSTVFNATSSQELTHYYLPTEKGAINLGTSFIPEKRFKELQKLIDGSLRGGLMPLGVLVSENGEYEMYINNKNSDSEVTIYFDDRASFDKTLENLLTFWQTTTTAGTSTRAFDYINLRFGNTVYYSTQ